MINDLIGIRAFDIRTHHYKMLFFRWLVRTRGMHVALHFPKRREQQLHGIFVLDGKDDYRLA